MGQGIFFPVRFLPEKPVRAIPNVILLRSCSRQACFGLLPTAK
jgi:hypothetical protein